MQKLATDEDSARDCQEGFVTKLQLEAGMITREIQFRCICYAARHVYINVGYGFSVLLNSVWSLVWFIEDKISTNHIQSTVMFTENTSERFQEGSDGPVLPPHALQSSFDREQAGGARGQYNDSA